MPSPMSMRLPRNHTESISDDHPQIVSWRRYAINTHSATAMSSTSSRKPMINIHRMGLAVNEVMPSIDSAIMRDRG